MVVALTGDRRNDRSPLTSLEFSFTSPVVVVCAGPADRVCLGITMNCRRSGVGDGGPDEPDAISWSSSCSSS